MTQMASNLTNFMEGFQRSQNETMTEIRKTQQEFFNSIFDTEGDFVGDENNTAVSPMSLENSEQNYNLDGPSAMQNLLHVDEFTTNVSGGNSNVGIQKQNTPPPVGNVPQVLINSEESPLLTDWLAQ